MKLRSIATFVVVTLLLMVSAVAQTSYSNSVFSASFNGKVDTITHKQPTSTEVIYTSDDGTISTSVGVRSIDHNIAVDFTATQFYRNQACDQIEGGKLNDVTNDAYYDGHPFSFVSCSFEVKGVPYFRMMRVIVTNPTTVVFIFMDVPQSIAAGTLTTDSKGGKTAFLGWVNFENSLTIK